MKYKYYWDIPEDCSEATAREIFQEIYDAGFDEIKRQHPNYTEDLYIENLRYRVTRLPLSTHIISNQIKLTWYLKFLDDQKKLKREFSNNELGLLAYYNHKTIAKNAGGAYNWFLHYHDNDNRLYNFTIKQAENQIKRIKKILPSIETSKKQRAIDEIQIIRSNLEKLLYRK